MACRARRSTPTRSQRDRQDASSVGVGSLDVIDHQHVNRPARRNEFEPELFLDRGEDRGPVGSGGAESSGATNGSPAGVSPNGNVS
jgi:hypothetical protein